MEKKLDSTREKISKLEDITIETAQSKGHRKKPPKTQASVGCKTFDSLSQFLT